MTYARGFSFTIDQAPRVVPPIDAVIVSSPTLSNLKAQPSTFETMRTLDVEATTRKFHAAIGISTPCVVLNGCSATLSGTNLESSTWK